MPTKARALYDCVADDVEELSFKEGDILVDGWSLLYNIFCLTYCRTFY